MFNGYIVHCGWPLNKVVAKTGMEKVQYADETQVCLFRNPDHATPTFSFEWNKEILDLT